MSTDIAGSVPLRVAVAEEIRALLGRRDISKIELARRIGRSHTYVWRRLSGEVAFDLDDLQRIAVALRRAPAPQRSGCIFGPLGSTA